MRGYFRTDRSKTPPYRWFAIAPPPPKLDAIKKKFADMQAEYFTDYLEMQDSGVCNAVIVATPHYFHPEMVMECLKRGIRVICDKPAGVYTKQVREMNEFALKHDEKFAMIFNQRTNCTYRKKARNHCRGRHQGFAESKLDHHRLVSHANLLR